MHANKSAIARDGGVTAVVFRYAREEENHFPHQTIWCRRASPGQYGFWLQILGLLNTVLTLSVNLRGVFGIPIPLKKTAS
jgi:hypothetical protein